MAPCETADDYYALLEVPQTATLKIIRISYLRLAVALHPDKNPHKPDATACFQRLLNAYETISDPDKRLAYDILWVRIKHRQSTEQEAKKRQAQATETERKRAAEETLNRQREQRASQERLRALEQLRSVYGSDIFEINRVIRRLEADLKRLQNQDDEELRKKRERNSWWTYFTNPVYGKVKETEEQTQQQENERLQRLASKSIKRNELNQKEVKLQSFESALQDVESKIAAEKKKTENEARAQAAKRHEQLRKEQEARRRAEAQQERERQAKWEAAQAKLQREEAARAAKNARDAQEAWETQERVRRAQAVAREAQEAQERARVAQERARVAQERARVAQERARVAQERVRAAREAAAARRKMRSESAATTSNTSYEYGTSASTTNSTCRHKAFWPKVQGSHLCGNCHTTQRRFAFQCPGCRMIGCASCRQSLRGERRRNDRDPSWRSGFDDDVSEFQNDCYFD